MCETLRQSSCVGKGLPLIAETATADGVHISRLRTSTASAARPTLLNQLLPDFAHPQPSISVPTNAILPKASQATRGTPRWLHAPDWAWTFVVLFLLLMVVGRDKLFRDPGVFWHTAFGEKIISGGGIPVVDEHSLTRFGKTWLDLQWLGECGMALAYRIGGWDTLLLLGAITLAAIYAWLAKRFVDSGLSIVVGGAILAIVLSASSHHFHVRPHLASIAFLGLTVALLVDIESRRKPLKSLLWLTPLFVIWANIHGGVLGGLATLVFVVAGWFVSNPLRRESPLQTAGAKFVSLAAVLAATAALFVTPHGIAGVETCIRLMRMPLPDVIQEHRPLNVFRVEGVAVVLLAIAYVAALRSIGFRKLRVTWLLPAVWLALAFLRVRHAPLFAISWGVVVAEMLRYSPARFWLAEHGLWRADDGEAGQAKSKEELPARIGQPRDGEQKAGEQKSGLRHGLAFAAVPVLFALALQAGSIPAPVLGHGWADLEGAGWPMPLADDLARLQSEQDRPLRVFNQLHYGGFVIFHQPQARVFIDDRCELYGFGLLSRYSNAESHEPAKLDEWFGKYKFDAALVATGSPFDVYLANAQYCELISKSETASLYRAFLFYLPHEFGECPWLACVAVVGTPDASAVCHAIEEEIGVRPTCGNPNIIVAVYVNKEHAEAARAVVKRLTEETDLAILNGDNN